MSRTATGRGARSTSIGRSALAPDAKAPVVVFIFGGSWRDGDKEAYRFVGDALTARGIVTVIADYRLYPETSYPGFVEDTAAAVAWTYRNIARFGGDPHRIFITGHSARVPTTPRWSRSIRAGWRPTG